VRRSLPLLLIASILPLGCGENQAARDSRDARVEFERVIALVHQVKLGYVPTDKGLAAMGQHKSAVKFDAAPMAEAIKGKSLRGYHAALLAQAEDELKALLPKGQVSQRVAAHQLLANLYLTSAGYDRRSGMKASDALSDPAASIETYLTGIERSTGLIGRFTGDDKPVIEKWSKNQGEVATSLTKLTGEVNALQGEVDGLQKQIDDYAKARDEAFKKSSNLRAEAGPKKGQEAFDLQIKAIEADREGNTANTKVDELTVTRDLAKAKLAIISREQGMVQAWSQTLAAGLGAADKRKAAMDEFEKTITAERAATLTRLSEDFKSLSANHAKAVDAKFDAALARVASAIETLKKAEPLATGDAKTGVKMELLDALVARLNTQADAIVATSRFGSIGDEMISRAGTLGDAATFAPAVEAVKTRLATLVDDSKKSTSEIAQLLADPNLASIKEGDVIGDARTKSIKSARALAASHAARLPIHQIGAKSAATPEPPAPAPAPAPAP
jgi:hypothetical protein